MVERFGNIELREIFLSASIPLANRDEKYYATADFISIRDSVIALAQVIVGKYKIVWGGHPSITPLIEYVFSKEDVSVKDHMVLYQSEYFRGVLPKVNNRISNIIFTECIENNRDESLLIMRNKLLSTEHKYYAGIFIGGMEGVEEECKEFKKMHPNALLLPIASTGAAARIIYNGMDDKRSDLLTNYCYTHLFEQYLIK